MIKIGQKRRFLGEGPLDVIWDNEGDGKVFVDHKEYGKREVPDGTATTKKDAVNLAARYFGPWFDPLKEDKEDDEH